MATRRKTAESEAREDAIRQYLDEIGAYRLLSAADEVELAKAIEKGEDAKEALEKADHTDAQRRKLLAIVRRGHEARHQFIQTNLRLVVSIMWTGTLIVRPLSAMARVMA